jgi:hypothetical protein
LSSIEDRRNERQGGTVTNISKEKEEQKKKKGREGSERGQPYTEKTRSFATHASKYSIIAYKYKEDKDITEP